MPLLHFVSFTGKEDCGIRRPAQLTDTDGIVRRKVGGLPLATTLGDGTVLF